LNIKKRSKVLERSWKNSIRNLRKTSPSTKKKMRPRDLTREF
jgi:hypothetical protein